MTRDLGDFFSGSGAEQEWQLRSGTRTQGRARENQRAASPTSKAPFSGDPPWAETASWRGANRPNDSEEQRRSRKDASTSFVAATRESDRTLMKTQHKLTSDPGVQTPDDTRGTFKSTSEDSAAQFEPFTSPQGEAALPSAVADCHFPSKTPRREPRSKGKWSRNAENEERVRFDASPNEEDVRSLLKQARSSKRQIVYSAENDEGNVEYKLFLSKLTPTKLAHRTTQMRYRLHEGAGVCFYLLGVTDDGLGVGISSRCMRASLQAVELMASSLAASAVVVYLKRVVEEAKGKRDKEEQEEKTERDRDEPKTRRARQFNREVEQSDGKHEKEEAELCETSEEGNVDWETVLERSETNGVRWIACVRVTQNGLTTSTVPSRATAQPAVSPDGLGAQRAGAVRVAVLGAHGAGKSSLVAVLAEEGTLDDGEGSARLRICMHPHEVLRGATSALHCASLPPSPTPSHSRPQPMLSRHLTDSPPLASSPSLSSESPPPASSLRRPGRGVRSSSAVQILLSPHVEEKRDNRRKERNQVDRNNAQRQSSATTPPRSCGSPSTSLSVHTPGTRRGSAVLNACYAPPPAASLAESEGGACAEHASQGGRPPEVNVREERDIQEGEDSAGTVATEITLLDMAGHPKYIKSALTGLLRECLGHVVLVLDASPEAAPLQVQLQEERVLLATSLILLRLPFTLVFNKWERRNCGIRTDTNDAGSAPAFSEPCASSVSLVGAEEGPGAEAASMRLSGVSRETKNRWGKRKEGERWRPNATAEAEEKAQLCAEVLGNLQAMFRVAGAVLEDSCLHRLSGPDGRAKHFCKREETKKVGEEAGEIEEEKVPTKAAEMARDPLVSSGSPRGLDGTGQRLLKHPRRRPRTATAKENCAVLLRTCLLSQRREQAREDGSNEWRERRTDEGRRREGDPSFTANLGVTTSRWFPLTCRGAFCVSCVDGQGIEQLRLSLQELSPWVPAEAKVSVSRDACVAPHGFSFKPRFAPLVSDEATTTVHPRPRVVCRPPLSSAFSGDERGDSRQEAECTDAASVEEQESEQDEKGLGAVLGGMLLQGRLNVGDCVLCGPLLSPSLSVSSGGSFPPFLSPPGVPRRPVETGDSVAKLHAMGEREENTDALHDGEAWRRGEREEENGESTGGEDEIDDGEIEEPSGGASFLWFWARVKSLRDSARQAVTFLPDTATPMKCSLAAVFLSGVAPVEDVSRQFANRKDSQRERRRQRGTNEGMKWEEGKEEQAGQEEEAGTEGKGREEGRERESDDVERRRSIATERTHREEGIVKLLRPGLLLVCVNAEREKRLFPGGFLESTKEETERRCAGGHCPLACMRGRGNLGCRPSPLPLEAEQVETFNKAAFRRQLIPSLPMPVAACWCRLHILAHPSELRKNNTLVVYTHAVRQAAEVLSILPLSASWHELMGVTANALACVNERMQFRSRVTKWGIQAQRRCRPDKEDERREREMEEGKTSTARRSCIRAGRKNRCLRSLSEAATSVGGRSGPVTLAPFDTGLVLLQFISEFGGELLASGLPIVVCSGVDVQGVGHVVAPCPQIPFFSQRFLVS